MNRIAGLGLLTAAALLAASCGRMPDVSSAVKSELEPRVDPDYTSLVIPPNIAPLNFRVQEPGRDCVVRISGAAGGAIDVHCPDRACRIPLEAWRRLLESNKGGRLFYDVFVQAQDGFWRRFKRFTNRVAEAPLDSYLVYRRLLPNKCEAAIRGIYQRDLESFDASPLVTLRDGRFTCFNCHTFCQHDPNRFLVHVRVKHPGMLLVMDGQMRKIDTKQSPMFRPLAYASWHPNGRHIAATCNRFIGHFPSNARLYYFQAFEQRGDLLVYDTRTNTLHTTAAVFGREYVETHPCWSHDGKRIYYSRGRDLRLAGPEDLVKVRFDLMRVAYDVDSRAWGKPETVKAYSKLGLSCAFPRPSPCGRYVLHILADKTTYPIHQKSSDVCLLDLGSGEHRRLDLVNSDKAESYPRWSLNGRWFTFLSNRRDGMSALPYFAYFDKQGKAHKAFVLPQEDPDYYDTFLDSYNVIELVTSRVDVGAFRLAQGMQQPARAATFPDPPHVAPETGAQPAGPSGY